MGLTRNRAFACQLALLAGALAVVAAAAAAVEGSRAGLWVLAAGALACALFATFSLRRYRQIARLASEVDEVLHGGRRIAFSDYREGDLAVLRNELAKMVAALRTATERLDAEKNALADALADVSHQIRTPLTAMGLLIGTAERTSDEAERIRALHELETLVSRVGWLVTALLKLAKADAGAIRVQARPVDAARLVRNAPGRPRRWATSSRTAWSTRPPADACACGRPRTPWPSACPSPTRARASPPRTFPACSSASTAARDRRGSASASRWPRRS